MRIQELAENLIKDYWTTAKQAIHKGKNWNSLNQEQQNRLIRYWAQQKALWKNKLSNELKNQTKQGQTFEKQIQEWIEISKFHEQRGKVKCKCYQCQEVQERLKVDTANLGDDYSKDKEQCSNCNRWVKELNELNGLCKNCLESYE